MDSKEHASWRMSFAFSPESKRFQTQSMYAALALGGGDGPAGCGSGLGGCLASVLGSV